MLEECSTESELFFGDFLITVIFHLIDTPEDTPIYQALKEKASKKAQEGGSASKSFIEEDDALGRTSIDLDQLESDLDKMLPVESESPIFEETAVPKPKEAKKPDFECPPQLCVSFLVTVVNRKGKLKELLNFLGGEEKKEPEEEGEGEIDACLELFCDGTKVGVADGSFLNQGPFAVKKLVGFDWKLVEESEKNPLDEIRFVSATTFRHKYSDCVYDRRDCIERCSILTSIDMPFPKELIQTNLDYVVFFLVLLASCFYHVILNLGQFSNVGSCGPRFDESRAERLCGCTRFTCDYHS